MATEKIFNFNYTLKTVVDGKEVAEKKSADAKAMQYDSVLDAVDFYEQKNPGKGEQLVLEIINNSEKSTAIANMRASLTRIPSIPKSIKEAAAEKLDENEKAAFNAIMAKLGIAQLK
jgi:hypothetical protein